MSIDHGRSPSEPGYSAEPEPKEVSAVPVSIPNAEPIPGDIVQITNEKHHWFPALVVVSENKAFGIQGFCFMPHNDGSIAGEAWTRLNFADYEPVGAAVLVISLSTATARASAIEARSDATTKIGAAEGESAVGNAETPKPLSSTNPNTERQSL